MLTVWASLTFEKIKVIAVGMERREKCKVKNLFSKRTFAAFYVCSMDLFFFAERKKVDHSLPELFSAAQLTPRVKLAFHHKWPRGKVRSAPWRERGGWGEKI